MVLHRMEVRVEVGMFIIMPIICISGGCMHLREVAFRGVHTFYELPK